MQMNDDLSNYIATGTHGMVTASHPLAAHAGHSTLQRGGNAMDAAITTAFALTVVDPCMCSIAGRGEINLFNARDGKAYNLEFIAVCGERARADLYDVLPREPGTWWSVKDDANKIGYQSICIPTALAGLCTTHEQFGTLELQDVLSPAIVLAQQGFLVDATLENTIDENFEKLNRFPATAKIFCPQGRPLIRGETLVMKDYAHTLNLIAQDGPEVFYHGVLADRIIGDIEAHDGLITQKDLETYHATLSTPRSIRYREFDVISGAPDCSGGRFVLQSLNILENFNLPALKASPAQFIHVLVETFKRAFADRLAFEGDPNFTSVPSDGLLSKKYAHELATQISLHSVTRDIHPGNPWRYDAQPSTSTATSGLPSGQNTTHLCTADDAGNMVALTLTLCGGYGSGVTIPGTGILMNNGMYWFNPVPGNSNSIEPGKRHIANMAATLVLKDGAPLLVTGSAGGRRILTTVTEMLINVLDFNMGVQAVAHPRFHIEEREPIEMEQTFFHHTPLAYSVVRQLKTLGHNIATLPSICIGCMILRDPETYALHGMAETRQRRIGSITSF
jgi:gamma-glutamyltranspeptidase/glutathione hydrolase